ncbi:response regulator [Halorientalis halophila]|uniref:response regulator n=1 Tax=Halorientalis halophila TaxID=3108499 RepID=UPI003009528F
MDIDSEGDGTTRHIRILHVDDDAALGDVVKLFLERDYDRFEVVTETKARDGLRRLETDDIDCIVSDYEMPPMDGLEFLETVRGSHPDIPFLLFTGKGSEEIASEAISRGVTDYLQKGVGTDQYEVLGNRIRNSVQSYRTEHELERSRAFLDCVLDLSPSAVVVLDGEGSIVRSNKLAETTLGLSKAEIADRTFDDTAWTIVDEDGDPVSDDAVPFKRVAATGKPLYDVEHGIERPDGEIVWLSINAAPLRSEDGPTEQVVAVLSDESNRKLKEHHEAETIRQLEGLGRVLSHDLGNALQIALGRLELARETGSDDHLTEVHDSLERAIDMLTDLTNAIEARSVVDGITTVDAGAIFARAWETQETTDARKDIADEIRIEADETALLRIFENLIRNALEHSPESPTVRVGVLANGFYVEDDGPGIPNADRDQAFEPGFTSKADGNGMGLPSIQQIALAHGWETKITDGETGGARFEFTNVA